MDRRNCARTALAACCLFVLAGCDLAYPEVVIVNRTGEHVLIKNASFNGCAWDSVLAYGDATAPGRCLPGEDRVHFQKHDAEAYCLEQAEDQTLEGVCPCDRDRSTADAGVDSGLIDEEPRWFNYRTLSIKSAEYGDFRVFEITLDDMEQDFSVPGPYGH
jgi:hypothetical protein